MSLTNLITRQAALFLPPKDPSEALFTSVGPVPIYQISVDPPNLAQLQQDIRKPVRALLRISGREIGEIGVHLKGAAGSTRGWDDKPGLTLNLDKFVKEQTLFGLEKLHLNNAVQDGTYFQELLANELALAMGIPACRCAHALVELNGRKVGLYVLKEGFDKKWVRRNFPNQDDGNLYDGGFCTDIDGPLKLDTGVENGHRDLKGLAGLCRFPEADQRLEALTRVLDLERFYANAALQVLTCDWDGYMRKPNNYRVYCPKKGGTVFVPHGMDQLWQNPEEGLFPGWGGMAARAVLETPKGRQRLIEKLQETHFTHFTTAKLHNRIEMLAPRALEALKSTGNPNLPGWFEGEVRGLKERLSRRVTFVKNELRQLS